MTAAPRKPLTPKQEAFCRAYLESGNASAAYRKAYDVGEDTKPEVVHVKASELAANGNVTVRLQELRNQAAEVASLDRAWVLERLMLNARIALGQEKARVTIRNKDSGTSEDVETFDRDPGAANKALELLGKELAMFVDRSETNATITTISADPISPDQWEKAHCDKPVIDASDKP